MTVAEMRQRMSGEEFTMWIAFLNERSRREMAELKRQQQRAARR